MTVPRAGNFILLRNSLVLTIKPNSSSQFLERVMNKCSIYLYQPFIVCSHTVQSDEASFNVVSGQSKFYLSTFSVLFLFYILWFFKAKTHEVWPYFSSPFMTLVRPSIK